MKKSIIWLLTIVMALTFGCLLYFQIMYLENMVKMREGQFSENVMRSLYATAGMLEKQETLHFLEEDANVIEMSLADDYASVTDSTVMYYSVINPDGTISNLSYSAEEVANKNPLSLSGKPVITTPSAVQTVGGRYRNLQEAIRSQYLYQKGLLNEVILSILRDASSRPVMERADSTMVRTWLTTELANNGLRVPFVFAVADKKGTLIYTSAGYDETAPEHEIYSQALFPHTDNRYQLLVEFPTKKNYIFSSVRFIIPTLAFTLILLVVFLYTIILAFRQKKLSEMKTDFINNMTHELKTPISTISLAGQMLSDDSVRKSPATLKHLSSVITEESKRLRFQVDKVLQLSVFDNSAGALKFTEVNVNPLIANIVQTFKIKVEKFGGSLTSSLNATQSTVCVDEMQFTNVINNLLDNAVKYMREDVEPQLEIKTLNPDPDHLEIRVTDNGIGIKRDDIKRIFDKFYRVPTGNRHDVKGFGLGLAYVKKMITSFGGTINATSEFGKWTTFTIILPVEKPQDAECECGEENENI